ncbi:hypothetical protein Zmor_010210 [Zophobas morio]|uniref:Uncharacterized protein n=1 Tax=Zophobas morio TaxID=2755281 RepID=A0AA38MIP4_9CUCU|nr:hypothetical protein Zmor_010210 [Zophobas morio]
MDRFFIALSIIIVFNICLLYAVPVEQESNSTQIKAISAINQSSNDTLCLYGFEYVNGTCKEIFRKW